MPRVSEVSESQVAEICTALYAKGESVSFAKVYAALGHKGGQAVISDHIRAWRKSVADRVQAKRKHATLPPALVEGLDALAVTVWSAAVDHANVTLASAKAELTAAHAEADARVAAAESRVAALDAALSTKAAELNTLQAVADVQLRAVADAEARAHDLHLIACNKEEQIAGLREDLGRCLATLDSERSRHTEAIASLTDQHTAALAQVEERHAGERSFLMQQTDDIRQASKLQTAHLQQQLDAANNSMEAYRVQAGKARDEVSRLQGKLELVQQEAAAQRELLDRITKRQTRATRKVSSQLSNT